MCFFRDSDKETPAEQVGWEAIKRAQALRMPSALWRPVHTLKAKWTEELFSSWQWNKWPVGISGLIWPFGSNQWPRNQNSLVFISSRAVKVIRRGGLHLEGRWRNVLPPRKRRQLASSRPLSFVPLKGNWCPVGSSRKWVLFFSTSSFSERRTGHLSSGCTRMTNRRWGLFRPTELSGKEEARGEG